MVAKLWRVVNDWIGVETRAMYLYRLDAAAYQPAEVQPLPFAEWSMLQMSEIPELTAVSAPDLYQASLRLQRGDKCYIARIDGRIAHHIWVQTSGVHPITEAGVENPVRDGEFWIYHAHTAYWARGRKLYPTALGRILCDHFRTGFKTGWVYTQDFNVVSQHGIERSQFERVGILRALRCGRMYLPVRSWPTF